MLYRVKKLIAFFLSLVMVLNIIPVSGFASEANNEKNGEEDGIITNYSEEPQKPLLSKPSLRGTTNPCITVDKTEDIVLNSENEKNYYLIATVDDGNTIGYYSFRLSNQNGPTPLQSSYTLSDNYTIVKIDLVLLSANNYLFRDDGYHKYTDSIDYAVNYNKAANPINELYTYTISSSTITFSMIPKYTITTNFYQVPSSSPTPFGILTTARVKESLETVAQSINFNSNEEYNKTFTYTTIQEKAIDQLENITTTLYYKNGGNLFNSNTEIKSDASPVSNGDVVGGYAFSIISDASSATITATLPPPYTLKVNKPIDDTVLESNYYALATIQYQDKQYYAVSDPLTFNDGENTSTATAEFSQFRYSPSNDNDMHTYTTSDTVSVCLVKAGSNNIMTNSGNDVVLANGVTKIGLKDAIGPYIVQTIQNDASARKTTMELALAPVAKTTVSGSRLLDSTDGKYYLLAKLSNGELYAAVEVTEDKEYSFGMFNGKLNDQYVSGIPLSGENTYQVMLVCVQNSRTDVDSADKLISCYKDNNKYALIEYKAGALVGANLRIGGMTTGNVDDPNTTLTISEVDPYRLQTEIQGDAFATNKQYYLLADMSETVRNDSNEIITVHRYELRNVTASLTGNTNPSGKIDVPTFHDKDGTNTYYYNGEQKVVVSLIRSESAELSIADAVDGNNALRFSEGQLTEGYQVSYATRPGETKLILTKETLPATGSEHQANIYFYGYDKATTQTFNPGTEQYYILSTIREKGNPQALAYGITKVSFETQNADGSYSVQIPAAHNVMDADGKPEGTTLYFNPADYSISTRLYHSSALPENCREAVDGTDTIEGYDFMSNTIAEDGMSSEIKLHSKYDKTYYVRFEFDPTDSTATVIGADENIWLLIELEHKTTGKSYHFEKLGPITAASEYIDISMSGKDWYKNNNTSSGEKITNFEFTGNEKANIYLVKMNSSSANFEIPKALSETDCMILSEGYMQKGYEISYPARRIKETASTSTGSSVIYDYVRFRKPEVSKDYNFKSILGNGLYYGITAEKLQQNNHLQTNFAVNHFSHAHSNITPNLSGDSAGLFYVGTIDAGQLRMDSSASQSDSKIIVFTDPTNNDKITKMGGNESLIDILPESADTIKNSIVDPIISHARTVSADMAANDPTFALITGKTANEVVIDTTGLEDGTTIYIDADKITKFLKNTDALKIKKNENQVIVFNFDETKDVTISQFKVSTGNETTWIDSTTSISQADGTNTTKEKIARTIVWNVASPGANVTLDTIAGIVLVPDGNITITGSSAGWIVCGGTVTNNNSEWHNIYSQMPSVVKANIVAKKTVNSVNATSNETFSFSLYKFDGTSWGTEAVKTVDNVGASIEFTDLDVAAGWNIFKITEGTTRKPDNTYTLSDKVFYAAVPVAQLTDETLVAGQALYYEQFTETEFKSEITKEPIQIGLKNEINGTPVFANRRTETSKTTNDEITIHKVDESGSPLGGATFGVFRDKKCTLPVKEYSGSSITISTRENALIRLLPEILPPLETGDPDETGNVTLYLKETKAPDEYNIDNRVHELKITKTISKKTEDSAVVTRTTFTITIDNQESLTVANRKNGTETIDISGTKTWVDGKTSHTQPALTLKRTTETNPAASDWNQVNVTPTWNGMTYTYSGLDKYDASGAEYKYEVNETPINGYATTYTENATKGRDFVNTELTSISGKKTWNGQETWLNGMHVTLTLKRNNSNMEATTNQYGAATPSVTIGSQQTVQWTNLPKYYLDGTTVKEYQYTVEETGVTYNGNSVLGAFDRSSTTSAAGTVIINNAIKTRNITVTKSWTPGWPTDVTAVNVVLKANGNRASVTDAEVALTSTNPSKTWSNVPAYDNTGARITYTVEEVSVTKNGTIYTSSSTVKLNDMFNVSTNPATVTDAGAATLTNEVKTKKVNVHKVWVFEASSGIVQENVTDGTGGKWPKNTTVTVKLYKTVNGNKTEAGSAELTKAKTRHEFTGLPYYDGLNAITYSIEEAGISGVDAGKFTKRIEGDAQQGYTITNSEKAVGLTITKHVDGKTLTAAEKEGITFTVSGVGLAAPLTKKLSEMGESMTWTLTQGDGIVNGQTYTVTERGAAIEKYIRVTKIKANNGTEQTCTDSADGVNASISVTVDATTGIGTVDITNKYTGEKISISGTKTWVDYSNGYTTRPENLKIKLYKVNGTTENEVTLQSGNSSGANYLVWTKTGDTWTYTITNVAKYDSASGAQIVYKVKETQPTGYTAASLEASGTVDPATGNITGANFTNTAYGKIKVDKTVFVNGATPVTDQMDDVYYFALYQGTKKVSETKSITVTGNGKKYEPEYVVFDNLVPGIYTVKELKTATGDATYDTYEVTVSVKADSETDAVNGVSKDVTVNGDEHQVHFINNQIASLTIEKELVGGGTGTFVFTVTKGGKWYKQNGEESSTEVRLMLEWSATNKSLTVQNLNAGIYTVTEVTSGNEYLVEASYPGTPYTATPTITGTLEAGMDTTVLFRNTRKGSLAIEKKVAVNGTDIGVSTPAAEQNLADGSYEFEIQGPDSTTVAKTVKITFVNGKASSAQIDSEVATVSAANGKVMVSGLVPGSYTILEKTPENGAELLEASVSAGSGNSVNSTTKAVTVKVEAGNTANVPTAVFRNSIMAASIPMKAEKHLSGREFRSGDAWTFTVTAEAGTPMPANPSVTIRPESGTAAEVDFGTIAYGPADAGKTYVYTITETGEAAGVVNDKNNPKTVTVKVAADGNGKLTATEENGKSAVNVNFTNTYTASGSTGLKASKTLTGRTFRNGDQWTFTVTADPATAPMPEKTVVQVTPEEGKTSFEVDFGSIAYTLEDAGKTYAYTITETGSGEGVVNDSPKTVTVRISDNGDGTLKAENSSATEAVSFINKYSAEGMTTLKGTKTLTGRTFRNGDQWTFTVTADPATAPMPEKTVVQVTPEAGKTSFDVDFGSIAYTLEDVGKTYVYTITETGSGEGVVNDSPKTVTVRISDNGDGTLKAENSSATKAVSFINKYSAEGETTLKGTKVLSGRAFRAGDEWTFTVTADSADAPMPERTTLTVKPVNGNSTVLDFGKIRYTLADLKGASSRNIAYTITETGNVEHVRNDTAKTVRVTLKDSGSGKLDVSIDTAENPLVFTNTYDQGSLTVEKHVVNGTDPDREFAFTVTLSDNGITGTYGEMKFVRGVAKFTLKDGEKKTATGLPALISYQAEEEAAAGYTTQAVNAQSVIDKDGTKTAIFTNTYSAAGRVQLKAEKVMIGRELKAEEFSFELKNAAGKTLQTKKNAADGSILFDEIQYTEADIAASPILYTISEVEGTDGDVTYDEHAVTVKVTLTDNGDGTITAAADEAGRQATFINTCSGKGEIVLTAQKILTGRELKEGEFSFELKDADGNVLQTRKNAANGTVVFDPISYTSEDAAKSPIVYTISEIPGSDRTVLYDRDAEKVTVTLKDNGDGTVTAEADRTGAAIAFTNHVIRVRKQDIASGDEVSGCEIRILDEDGKTVDEWTSEAGKPHEILNLETGKTYTLHEKTAPDGYTVTADATFTVDEEGQITGTAMVDSDGVLLVKDAKTRIRVLKTDILTGEELEGSHIQILDRDGNVADEWVSTLEAHETEGLKTGEEYILRETVAPLGYNLTVDAKFTIDENGKVTSTGTVREDGVMLVKDALTTTEAAIRKVWKDDENRDGRRPAVLTVKLLADGEVLATRQLTAANNWTLIEKNLRKTDRNGKDIVYTWEEVLPDGYTQEETRTTGTLTTLTNTYGPAKTEISVRKVWDDDNNSAGKRPAEIRMQLFAEGEAEGDPVILNEGNGWRHTWKDLYRNIRGKDGESRPIRYTVEEIQVPEGYEPRVTGDAAKGFVITNRMEKGNLVIEKQLEIVPKEEEPEEMQALIDIPVNKIWDDDNNRDGNRPASITVRLYAGGEEIDRVTLSEDNGWAHTFTELPKYLQNKTIRYSISEDPVDMYVSEIRGFTVVNKYRPQLTSTVVQKIWDDNDNEFRIRPGSIRMTLSNGTSVLLNEGNHWTAIISNLPAVINGEPVTYTWTEQDVPGYRLVKKETHGNVTVFTNETVKLAKVPAGEVQPKYAGETWVVFEEYDTALGGETIINHVGDCFD